MVACFNYSLAAGKTGHFDCVSCGHCVKGKVERLFRINEQSRNNMNMDWKGSQRNNHGA